MALLSFVEGAEADTEKRGEVLLRHFQRCTGILGQMSRFFSELIFRTVSGFSVVRRMLPSESFSSFQAREGASLPLPSAAISVRMVFSIEAFRAWWWMSQDQA